MSGYAVSALADALGAMRTGRERVTAARVVAALVPSFEDEASLARVMATLVVVAEADDLVRVVFDAIVPHAPARAVYVAHIDALLAAASPATHFDLLATSRDSPARAELAFDRVLLDVERVFHWAEATRARPAETVGLALHAVARRSAEPWQSGIVERWPELVTSAMSRTRMLVMYTPTPAGFVHLARAGRHERLGSPTGLALAPLDRAIAALETALSDCADEAGAVRLGRWLGELTEAREARA